MKIYILFLLGFITLDSNAQIKTLIPESEEINLPLDDNKQIYLSTTLDESLIKTDSLVPIFINEIKKTMNPKSYFIIDSGQKFIELFIVSTCKGFNIEKIQSHQLINEGIITSSLYINFKENEYTITLKDFDWVNNKKQKTNLSSLYHSYLKTNRLKDKITYYGILKSAELSIIETFNNVTVIIEEIIKIKSDSQ